MASDRRRTCQTCGNHDSLVGPISWRGNCETCGLERLVQSVYELHEKRGPMYRRWHARLTEALENTHLDDAPARP